LDPGAAVVGGRRAHRRLLHHLLLFGLVASGQQRQRHQRRQDHLGHCFHGLHSPKDFNHATLRCHSACSAWATAGGTNAETSPPRREIWRTSEDEMNPYSSAGVRNRVSAWGIRWRFMLASWNSYSKSDTARKPRNSTPAPSSRTKLASSPSNPRTSTFGKAASALRASSTRRARGSAGRLAGLSATPTTSRSNSGEARCTRSTCPFVIGSNVPG